MPLTAIAATFAGALVLALVATPLAVRLGLKLGIADKPGGRRRHSRTTSRLGAVPLFIAFIGAALLAQTFNVPTLDPQEDTRFSGLLIGSVVIFVAGLLDDRLELRAGPQFAAQTLAAGIAIAHLVFIERFHNPLIGREQVLTGWPIVALSLFWYLGMMNTVNFLDGIDGLAATVSLIAAGVTTIHMMREGQYSVALLPIALMGALMGFLVFNVQPARIFLGSGAQYLGFTLACLGIIAGAKVALLLLVMGVPIADVAWQVIDRLRRGKSPFEGDRGHLHLRLADAGWSARRIVALYAAVCITFGGVALLIQPPVLKLITLGVVLAGVVITLALLSSRAQAFHAPPTSDNTRQTPP
ncbi:MAG: MraY family glycosyltransferase [Anaerolineae bacterium]|nr:undecaprenyl/decaprenyl-phosphate alpha-N-acetylglucosaminyl 1-phosphate transferase [Thermoflexales bacterium]MDW8406190.1 MraY family glycosyltransferase [Anaerolineae bacterium]